MLRQQLQQKLQQKLSPAQIQVIKMLEVPTLELEERIRQELEENPALEEGMEQDADATDADMEFGNDEGGNNDDFDPEEYMMDDDIPDYKMNINNLSKDDKREDIPFSAGMTFHEALIDQLGLLQLTEHQHMLAEYVIGNIDDEGYLRRSAESMVDDIVFQAGIQTTDEEMLHIIELVRQFDPPGVGATTLQECLLLQLKRRTPTPDIRITEQIIKDYFEEFSKKHYDKITRALDIDDEQLKKIITEITRLNPKPGNAWGGNILGNHLSRSKLVYPIG